MAGPLKKRRLRNGDGSLTSFYGGHRLRLIAFSSAYFSPHLLFANAPREGAFDGFNVLSMEFFSLRIHETHEAKMHSKSWDQRCTEREGKRVNWFENFSSEGQSPMTYCELAARKCKFTNCLKLQIVQLYRLPSGEIWLPYPQIVSPCEVRNILATPPIPHIHIYEAFFSAVHYRNVDPM